MRGTSLLLPLAALLMVTSCASGDDEAASSPATTTPDTRPELGADQAAAQAALLTLSDFPAGWSEVPADDEGDDDADREVAACVGQTGDSIIDTGEAEASTGDFTDPEGNVTISETVGLAVSADDATSQLAALDEPGVTGCIQSAFRDFIADQIDNPPTPADSLPEGASVGDVTFGRLNVTSVGDQTVAYRATIPISVEGFNVDFYIDVVLVRVGRSIAALNVASVLSPYPTEQLDALLATAVQRLPG